MVWAWLRIAVAVVGFSGVVAGFIVNVDRARREGQDLGLVLANYFSLFTIVSTIILIVTFVIAGLWSLRNPGRSPEPRGIALAIAGITGPILLLGIVYNALLRGLPSEIALTDPSGIHSLDVWATESLHVIIPLYLLVDLFFASRRRALSWWSLAVIVAYPLLWLTYTLIRGGLTPDPSGAHDWWYPYPFLDPHGGGGWPSVLIYVAVMLVVLVAIGAGIVAVGRLRSRRAAARTSPVGAAG
ncbi:Pr6Pr family membrane protein [Microbacterium aoyamense]|uniref:Pr6Pr family membrane protein n=1 Tax=Microbacterium aoyamense TaxID=344166 RepID=A0ABP5AVW2_9MICO|nr:Pr6Pr family membrane protein [Microbacterium aoyamense]